MSRLLPSNYGGRLKNPRPGLQDKYGKVFLACLEVTAWVREFNPNCEIFCETLPFTDLVADWKVVCLALGQLIVIDSADHSFTRRRRACWTNMHLPPSQKELTRGLSPIDPNQYMGPGRTLKPYFVDGKPTVRTIVASWTSDPDHPRADTGVPVLVYDQRYEQHRSLQAEEAELLMGFPAGSTSGRASTQIEALRALGDSVTLGMCAHRSC